MGPLGDHCVLALAEPPMPLGQAPKDPLDAPIPLEGEGPSVLRVDAELLGLRADEPSGAGRFGPVEGLQEVVEIRDRRPGRVGLAAQGLLRRESSLGWWVGGGAETLHGRGPGSSGGAPPSHWLTGFRAPAYSRSE